MSSKAALAAIQYSLAKGRYFLTVHFRQRLADRGVLWVDVLCVFEEPTSIRSGGLENMGRPKWIVAGRAADGLPIEIVCVLDKDSQGVLTLLITVYFE